MSERARERRPESRARARTREGTQKRRPCERSSVASDVEARGGAGNTRRCALAWIFHNMLVAHAPFDTPGGVTHALHGEEPELGRVRGGGIDVRGGKHEGCVCVRPRGVRRDVRRQGGR